MPFEAAGDRGDMDELLRGVSEGMSEVTRLLAVVAGPSALGDSLSRVDYLPLLEGAMLLVVSTESGASSSTTVALPVRIEDGELREMFSALNAWVGGRPLGRLELATAARKALSDHNPLVVQAVLEAVEVLGQATERGVFVRGASALLNRRGRAGSREPGGGGRDLRASALAARSDGRRAGALGL